MADDSGKKKVGGNLLYGLFFLIIIVIIAYVVTGFLFNNGDLSPGAVFSNGMFLGVVGATVAIFLLIWIVKKSDKLGSSGSGKGGIKTQTKKGDNLEQYFDSRWITEKELRTEKQFMYCTWSTISQSKDGMLLRSQLEGNNLHINMYKAIHTMVIGTTGTGKTERFIIPQIQILAKTKSKPSFVITDPKGELYAKNNNHLQKCGYDVKVFNLRQPYASVCWNPLDNSYMMYHEAHELQKEVKVHTNVNPADLGLKIIAREYNYEWYEFRGVAYPNKESVLGDIEAKKAELIDLAENELREIAGVLCPIESKQDSSWERGAQEFIYGTMLAMLEDSMNPDLGMTRERFNFYNLSKICNYKDADPENPYKTLRQYFLGRDKFSKVGQLITTAINNAPTTTRSYMGIVGAKIGLFNDTGMCFATSKNEMNFDSYADKPTALFIIIPDEKESRHGIATMMISQLYNKLVDLANKYPEQKLPRITYFMMDEFANLPKIEKIAGMITVARSRNIFFALVLQSFSQLNAKYGDDVAAVLKGNCPIKIFVGTDDHPTCEEFSKLCGDISIKMETESKTKQKEDTSKTTNVSMVSRPLIYPDELGHLEGARDKTGTIIVKILNEFPIKCKSTYAWATPMFDTSQTVQGYVPSRALDEARVSYSIIERNRKILSRMSDF
ncbi:MAG: type IV secretory system conjugative DNA transfer family protein [Christensenellaceae bacterium]|jgi:type IV secretory pathway TraG/TraD family ATPase VirD4|nr:type IV secretory system conjugative DNA transfer family protein [Christensenellaceae bacterium]